MAVVQNTGVAFRRAQFDKYAVDYKAIRDAIAGATAVKGAGTQYLPVVNPNDASLEAQLMYENYKRRATFYGVTGRTIEGMLGLVFTRDPQCEIPKQLEPMLLDADGEGSSLEQIASRGVHDALAIGRCALWVDYPAVDGALSLAEKDRNNIRPTITFIPGDQIINWRTKKRGARTILSMLVWEYEQEVASADDEFEMTTRKFWKVLRLVNDVYRVETYTEDSDDPQSVVTPILDGKPMNELPVVVIGADNNTIEPSKPPMLDIALLNLQHYKNSADYEDSTFLIGQPTPVFTGLTVSWYNDVLKGKIALGSRASIALPVGADAKILQAQPNTQAFEAMTHKEAQMVALGAKLLETSNVRQSATEAAIDDKAGNSQLQRATKNVAAGVAQALVWAAKFEGVPPQASDGKPISYELNTEFELVTLSPEQRRQLVMEWQSGVVAFEEVRNNLRRAGVAYLNDKDAKAQITKELDEMDARKQANAEAAAALKAPANDPTPKPASGGRSNLPATKGDSGTK